jgi:hypothetical protein
MNNKKLMTLPVILIIGLAGAGAAYAAWFDIVTIDGTVVMGSFTVAWNYTESPICGIQWYDHETGIWKPLPANKIGETRCEIYPDPTTYIYEPKTGKDGYLTMNWTIENAYPQIKFLWTNPKIQNIGTIPAMIYNITVTGYDVKDDEELRFVWTQFGRNKNLLGAFWDDGEDDTWDTADDLKIINLYIPAGWLGTQFDPCSGIKSEIDLDFEQEAEECHTYTFSITIDCVQWNKYYEVVPPDIP